MYQKLDVLVEMLLEIKQQNKKTKEVMDNILSSSSFTNKDKVELRNVIYSYFDKFVFSIFVTKNYFPDYDESDKVFVAISLIIHMKRYLNIDITKDILIKLKDETTSLMDIKDEEIDKLTEVLSNVNNVLDIVSHTQKFLIKYNIPRVIYSRLRHQYTENDISKIFSKKSKFYSIAKNSKKEINLSNINKIFLINPLKANIEAIKQDPRLTLIERFVPDDSNLIKNYLIFNQETNSPIPSNKLVNIKTSLVHFSPVYFNVIDQIKISNYDEIAIIDEDRGLFNSAIYLANYKYNISLDNIFLKSEDYAIAKFKFNDFGFVKNTKHYLIDKLANVDSRIAKGSKDIVVLNKKNSEISCLHTNKAVLYRINYRRLLDETKDLIVADIAKSFSLVKKGGLLVYVSKSFIDLETNIPVQDFLRQNPEATLIRDNLVLPGSEDNLEGIYFAMIKRKVN